MVTILILLFAILVIGILTMFVFGTGGIIIFLVFGDAIIAGAIIYLIIRAVLRKHK